MIPEADWRRFKKVRSVALERFAERVLEECQEICRDESSTAHERYGNLYGLLQKRNRAMSRAFDDMRRSTAITCLRLMYELGLITAQELAQFGSKVQRAVILQP